MFERFTDASPRVWGLEALLREFPESPTTTSVVT